MTEDQMRQQEELLVGLGTTKEATEFRARLQIGTLKSDMQALKAANPGCVLSYFIRWLSPRDWIEEKIPSNHDENSFTSRFKLSNRMTAPDNIWANTWKEVEAVPITKQKPLFNPITEGEKALHFLEIITPSELLEMIIQLALNVVQNKFFTLECSKLDIVKTSIKYLPELLISSCGQHIKDEEIEGLCLAIAEAEKICSRATSIKDKFDDLEIVNSFLKTSECLLKGDRRKKKLISLFLEEDRLFEPEAKEFILRVMVISFFIHFNIQTPRPFPKSERVGNRMYILISANETRIASAFSLNE